MLLPGRSGPGSCTRHLAALCIIYLAISCLALATPVFAQVRPIDPDKVTAAVAALRTERQHIGAADMRVVFAGASEAERALIEVQSSELKGDVVGDPDRAVYCHLGCRFEIATDAVLTLNSLEVSDTTAEALVAVHIREQPESERIISFGRAHDVHPFRHVGTCRGHYGLYAIAVDDDRLISIDTTLYDIDDCDIGDCPHVGR